MLAEVLTAPAPQLTYLEDPDVGSSALEVMITTTAAASLNMYCRGGDGCCGREDTRWGAAAVILTLAVCVQAVWGGGGGLRH